MTTPTSAAARWRVAGAAGGTALLAYILTLAPTVTFWDSGELLAAAKGLGIPHPPGSPFFVLVAHVWAMLLPFGTFAWRVNLLAAVTGALTVAFLALALYETIRPQGPGAESLSVVSALVAGFTLTHWQNSNETEVYAVATAMIAVIIWLALRWRAARETNAGGSGSRPVPARYLLLILYLFGLAVGDHLLTLLAGPAVIAFLYAEERRLSVEVAVVTAVWVALVATGLGSGALLAIAGVGLVAASIMAARDGQLEFALLGIVVAVIGMSTYVFLLIRAGQHPVINEMQPDSWGRLVDVIRRGEYPIRTPLDDPTVAHGVTNPGRSLSIIGLQLVNYAEYFSWQWGAALPDVARGIVATAFASLGFFGSRAQWRSDRSAWWLFFVLWLVAGLGLVAYLNFKPGFSQAYGQFPDPSDHEVRERDYFFVVSFLVWGCWAGLQLMRLAAHWWSRQRAWRVAGGVAATCALLPLALNWPVADRRGPDRTLARDLAWDLLNSVGPYGVLVTYGDNDTFPLWYLQEVEGVRQDVTVVCLALANTDWYVRQLRDAPTRPFDEAAAPPIWRGRDATPPDRPLLAMTDADIAGIAGRLIPVERTDTLTLGPIRQVIPGGITLAPNQFVLLRILQQ
ncbi:MAG: glycosyltransferase family 117 protein, partial [Gemmatimonadales bacterium]